MVRFAAFTVFASLLSAQTFDTALPDSVPKVAGSVVAPFALRYIDVAQGTGEPAKAGQQYTAQYTGWLRDGTKFDSSVDRKEPFVFVQGRRQVIAGWEAGFEGMKVGGKRRLFIPYQLAYGERGTGSIPPKAELIFDVELLGVKDVPEVPASNELILVLSDLEQKATLLAKAVPASKYDWRPAPDARSFREVFIHIANGNRLLLSIAQGSLKGEALQKTVTDNAAKEKQATTRDEVVNDLTASFAEVRKYLEPLRAGVLAQEVDMFGRTRTRRAILTFLDTHVAEHVGQAIAYARMNGIVPPWSAGGKE